MPMEIQYDTGFSDRLILMGLQSTELPVLNPLTTPYRPTTTPAKNAKSCPVISVADARRLFRLNRFASLTQHTRNCLCGGFACAFRQCQPCYPLVEFVEHEGGHSILQRACDAVSRSEERRVGKECRSR